MLINHLQVNSPPPNSGLPISPKGKCMNRQHTNSEDTITTLFVEILMPMSATWSIHEQTTKPLVENQGKPDVIIRTVERYPMAIEVKIDYKRGPNETGEKQAREQYLGMTLGMTLETLTSAIAIRLPYRFRTMPRDEIRENLEASKDLRVYPSQH